jgi:hypothetical protein
LTKIEQKFTVAVERLAETGDTGESK